MKHDQRQKGLCICKKRVEKFGTDSYVILPVSTAGNVRFRAVIKLSEPLSCIK